jgi:hypothetical protein
MAVLFGLVRGVLTRLSGTGKKRPTFEIVQAGARFQTALRQAQGERLQPAAHLTTRRTSHRRDQEYCAMPSPLAAMKVIFSCTDTKVEPWLQGLCAALPGAEISVWQPGASLADHAVVWAPLQQLMDEPHPTPHTSARTLREESIAQIAGNIVAQQRGEAIAGIVDTIPGY